MQSVCIASPRSIPFIMFSILYIFSIIMNIVDDLLNKSYGVRSHSTRENCSLQVKTAATVGISTDHAKNMHHCSRRIGKPE